MNLLSNLYPYPTFEAIIYYLYSILKIIFWYFKIADEFKIFKNIKNLKLFTLFNQLFSREIQI